MRIVLALMWLLHWLPLSILGRIGETIGSILFVFMGRRRHICLTNIKLCLPHLNDDEQLHLAKSHFRAYARSVLERGILWWGSEQRLRKLIRVESDIPLDSMFLSPTILLCPHFVSLDVGGVAVMLKSSLCSIYTKQRNKVFDQALRKGRTRFRPIELFSRSEGVKPILRAMKKNLPYFMLPDMDFGAKDAEFVSFFGVPAATLTSVSRIATATNAKVIPVIATTLPNYQGWNVKFDTPWKNYPCEDLIANTRFMNAYIEAEIIKAPEQYFWTHRRFKTRPAGENTVY